MPKPPPLPQIPAAPAPPPVLGATEVAKKPGRKAQQPTFLGAGDQPSSANSNQKTLLGQ